ncbi:MAG TPA: TetR/AcrR family transcriptional regulator [Solirubrobacterales bacterium]|nr:TetR/AcrR family transcriptional regulator [Solirubrobacterales bacterium]
MEESRTRSEKSDATRLALIESARRLFGSSGYAQVSLAQIVDASGLTKGALYHHFPGGKRDLMEAVYEQVETEFTEMVAAGVMPRLTEGDVDALSAMEQAIEVTLEASLDPELQQIVLIDSPSVLGWTRWREIADDHSLAVVKALLKAAEEQGAIRPVPTEPLAYLLMASLNEAILMVARADDQARASAEASEALRAIIEGLRAG